MIEQLRLVPGRNPDALIEEAAREHRPIASFCLFSGGNDSAVAAHRCREHYDELAWLDTGTAIPGVEECVVEFAAWLGKPLRILRHDFDAFRLLVLGGEDWKGDHWEPLGFPGPAQHGLAYNRLKGRLIERLLREAKAEAKRRDRVMFITGIRRAESQRRSKRLPINRKHAAVFVSPLIDWTRADLDHYRREHRLPESDVAALCHRSGECNCGSYAQPGEREMIASLWPEWWSERIEPMEREAEAAGVRYCRWGGFDLDGCRAGADDAAEEVGVICSGCEQLPIR